MEKARRVGVSGHTPIMVSWSFLHKTMLAVSLFCPEIAFSGLRSEKGR